MMDAEEKQSVLTEYFGLDFRRLLIFVGLVIGVLGVVTLIYVSIFGYDSWTSNMSQASSLMLSNFNPQAGAPCPNGGLATPAPAALPLQQSPSAQYQCPTCGAVGLPLWSQTGTPTCPSCGALMAIAGQAGANFGGGGTQLAAAP